MDYQVREFNPYAMNEFFNNNQPTEFEIHCFARTGVDGNRTADIEGKPKNINKQKVDTMSRQEAINKIIEYNVKIAHYERKLKKLDVAKEAEANEITRLGIEIENIIGKITDLEMKYAIDSNKFDYVAKSNKDFGGKFKNGMKDLNKNIGKFVKENKNTVGAIAAVGTIGTLIALLVRKSR